MSEWISGNVFIRPNILDKEGHKIEGHSHNFDHTTIFFKGNWHVKAELPNGQIIEKRF